MWRIIRAVKKQPVGNYAKARKAYASLSVLLDKGSFDELEREFIQGKLCFLKKLIEELGEKFGYQENSMTETLSCRWYSNRGKVTLLPSQKVGRGPWSMLAY